MKGNTCCRNADTSFFFVFFLTPPSSRDLCTAAGVDLTTYGMVGSMTGHMTGLKERRKAGGGMSEGVMNTQIPCAWLQNGSLRSYGPSDYRT